MTTDILLAASLKNFKKFVIQTPSGTTSYSFGPLFDAKGFTVDWGDGIVNSQTSHTYASANYYSITVKYTKLNIINNSTSDSSNVLIDTYVSIPEENSIVDAANMYYGDTNLLAVGSMWLKKALTLRGLFEGCYSLSSVGEVLTQVCQDFSYMYGDCNVLQTVQLCDTSNGTDFSGMHIDNLVLNEVPAYNTSNGIFFTRMFQGCSGIQEIPALDVSKGTDFTYMFDGCNGLTSILAYGFRYDLDISRCPLGHDALVILLNNLGIAAASPTNFYYSSLFATLTSEEKAIATGKGWTILDANPPL